MSLPSRVTAERNCLPWQHSVESSISTIFWSFWKKREKMAAERQRGARSTGGSDVSRPVCVRARSYPSLWDREPFEETQRNLWGNNTSGDEGGMPGFKQRNVSTPPASPAPAAPQMALNSLWRLRHVINHGWNNRSGCAGLLPSMKEMPNLTV